MSGVVRYAHGKRNHVMMPAENGPFVRACDYDTLRAKLEAAKTSLDRLTGMKFSDRMHAALVARAEAAEANAARWLAWRALDEHAASDIAWAYDAMGRDAAIDAAMARTKEETK